MSTAGLAIGQHCRIVTFEASQHQIPDALLIYFLLTAHFVEHSVELVAPFATDDDFLGGGELEAVPFEGADLSGDEGPHSDGHLDSVLAVALIAGLALQIHPALI